MRTELLHDHSNIRITVVQMPAVNTPQFSWVRSRLPRHPQPVPPIYQPEVAAQGVLFAAEHPQRKEYWVGGSTAATIFGQKFAAPLLDRYLARTGYDSQQTGQPGDPGQPGNLWQPLDQAPGSDHGAHGEFDDQASSGSEQLTAAEAAESAGAKTAELAESAGAKTPSCRAARRRHPRVRLAHRRQPAAEPVTSTVAAQLFDADFPRVDGVTAEVYKVPTDRPEADGTLAWSKTTLVLVRVTGGGTTGLGYTYATGACKAPSRAARRRDRRRVHLRHRHRLAGDGPRGSTWAGPDSSPAPSRRLTSLWDLKATLLDLPLSRLLGLVRGESRFTAAAGSPPTTSPRRAPSSSGGPGTCASPG